MHAPVALFDETLLNILVNSYQTEKKLSQAVILLGWLKILKIKLKFKKQI